MVSWFPENKKWSMSNRASAIALFKSFCRSLPSSSIQAFSDGLVTEDGQLTSCAIFIPSWNIEESWSLTCGTSVFTAELTGIMKILHVTLHHPSYPTEVVIFSDSSAAIRATTVRPQTLPRMTRSQISVVYSSIYDPAAPESLATLEFLEMKQPTDWPDKKDCTHLEIKFPTPCRQRNCARSRVRSGLKRC